VKIRATCIDGQGGSPCLPALLYIYFVAVLLHACASSPPVAESGPAHIVHGVPFYAQETDRCGPASLAGVMNFWNVAASPAEIAAEIYSKSARGTLTLDMVLYPQRKGLGAEQYSGGLDDLRKKIDAGLPLIVLVDKGFSVLEVAHFMVIVGYDGEGVIANSGGNRGEFISEKDFLRMWKRTNYWTLLIKPGGP
jgi:ABC-type bacteriocin/lantibiotic exporter with double-glycine peptidase domain